MAIFDKSKAKAARSHLVTPKAYRAALKELNESLPSVHPVAAQCLPLGAFQVALLYAIQDLGKNAYGAEVRRWLQQYNRSKREINIGQVYGAAERLIMHRYIVDREMAPPGGKGRPVVVYSVTPFGQEAVMATLRMARASFHERFNPNERERQETSAELRPRSDRARTRTESADRPQNQRH